MDSTTLAFLAGAAGPLLFIGLLAGSLHISRRRKHRGFLRERFGDEFDRLARQYGSERAAMRDLDRRLARVRSYRLRRMSADDVQTLTLEWQQTEVAFGDNPSIALLKADQLVTRAAQACGYRSRDAETCVDDLSVSFPAQAATHRAAREMFQRNARASSSPDLLWHALVLYREVFDVLLAADATISGAHKQVNQW